MIDRTFLPPAMDGRHLSESDKYLFDWMQTNLPPASSYWVTDADYIIRDRKGNMMLIEKKLKGAKMKQAQSITYAILSKALQLIDGKKIPIMIDGKRYGIKIKYHGFHTLVFSNTTFENGIVFWDGQPISQAQLVKVLSFKK